jgi:hypothetical protein
VSRPPAGEWAVLDEGQDPVPGDPHEVRDEANRLGKMAQTIRDQIKRLGQIASDENVGRFAEKLEETAEELKGDLGAVADRYEEVSGYLGNWAGDLEYAQSESLKALHRAKQAAPDAKLAPPAHGGDQHPTPDQQHARAAADHARDAAQHEIEQAKRQLQSAKDYRDERGRHWMQKIEDSEHDSLKDSHWDSVKDFIHEHAGWIKVLADACTWVVTILVIASLFIPGVDIATGVLAGFMLAALLGHTALAVSGDGSWTDVAFDVVGLLTLGAGNFLGTALKGLADSAGSFAKLADSAAEVEDAGADVMSDAADAASDAGDLTEAAGKGPLGRFFEGAADYGKGVWQAAKTTGGEREAAENLLKLRELAGKFPDSIVLKLAADEGGKLAGSLRTVNIVANGTDQFAHNIGGSDLKQFVENGFHGTLFDDDHGWGDPNVEAPSNVTDHPTGFDAVTSGFGRFKELTTVGVGS